MSSSLSHVQLAMWMTPHEIKSSIKSPQDRMPKYSGGLETTDEMWDRKKKEAFSSGLTHLVKKHGVKKPVKLMPFMGSHILLDGYHRVAASEHNTLIPVEHQD